jgi:hypothetical protein
VVSGCSYPPVTTILPLATATPKFDLLVNIGATVLQPADTLHRSSRSTPFNLGGAIHQFLRTILKLRILVLLPVSTLPYGVKS